MKKNKEHLQLRPTEEWRHQRDFLSDAPRCCPATFERCTCTSSVSTCSSLSEELLFSLCAIPAAVGHIFVLLPGQLQSDATRVQIEDVCPKLGGRPVISHLLWESDVETVTATRPPEMFDSDCGWQTAHISEDGKLFLATSVTAILH